MGNIIMQSQPYPLSVTFNVFRQNTISPKVSVIESQSKSLYIDLGQILLEMLWCHNMLSLEGGEIFKNVI